VATGIRRFEFIGIFPELAGTIEAGREVANWFMLGKKTDFEWERG
jgi:hypothetical protein